MVIEPPFGNPDEGPNKAAKFIPTNIDGMVPVYNGKMVPCILIEYDLYVVLRDERMDDMAVGDCIWMG